MAKVKVRRVEGSRLQVIREGTITKPRNWDYNTSVNMAKPLVERLAVTWVELAPELLIARERLSKPGNPQLQAKTPTGAHAPVGKTWKGYCHDIGLSKSQANRIIAGYIKAEETSKSDLPTFGVQTARQLTGILERVQKHAADLKIDLKGFQELITAAVSLLDGRTASAPKLVYGEFVRLTQDEWGRLGEKLGGKVRD